MYSAVAFLLPILLTSQVFCQTRDRNYTIFASYNEYVEYVESLEDYGGEINPERGNDIMYESSADNGFSAQSTDEPTLATPTTTLRPNSGNNK